MEETALREIGSRHGFSADAVRVVATELQRGGGSSAQFEHAELGGRGQWMPGMVQIGAMWNARLKARVAALCEEVASVVDRQVRNERWRMVEEEPMEPLKPMKPMQAMKPMEPMEPAQAWWPARLGSADAVGEQDGIRYAYFRAAQRLIVDVEGYVATYDTADHVITGISQSQAHDASKLVFSSQHGPIALDSLRAVMDEG